ncbi:MAG: histone H1 [Prevotella sp.]|nr:histone H1 [Prevotella sp.]
MTELINAIKAQMAAISADIDKTDNAKARVRKATLELEKLGKQYRKETVK